MKQILFSFICFLICSFSYSNPTLLGLRLGNVNSGVTVQHYLNDFRAIEGIGFIFTQGNGVEFAGLYEFHFPFSGNEFVGFYCGFGAHIGFWEQNKKPRIYTGPDGILGLQYTFSNLPLNLAIDWHPFFNLISSYEHWIGRVGISGRYIF